MPVNGYTTVAQYTPTGMDRITHDVEKGIAEGSIEVSEQLTAYLLSGTRVEATLKVTKIELQGASNMIPVATRLLVDLEDDTRDQWEAKTGLTSAILAQIQEIQYRQS